MPAAETCERIDPRIRRTRQLLFEALETLLATHTIEDVTVGDIAAQASVNRGTFYDHYADKFALLEGLVEAKFQQLLGQRDIQFDGTCAYALIGITLAACDYMAGMRAHGCAYGRVTEKHMEAAITSVVRSMILGGLQRHPPHCTWRPELLAASMAGAIYGAAREWVHGAHADTAESVAQGIFSMFQPLLWAVDPAAHARKRAG